MAIEDHSNEIKCFTLVPVGRFPKVRDRVDMSIVLRKEYFQTEPLVMHRREKVIVDLKTRIVFRASVAAAKIGQEVKTMLFFEKSANVNDRSRRDGYGYFPVSVNDRDYPRLVLFFKFVYELQ